MSIDDKIMKAFVSSTLNVMRTTCFEEDIVPCPKSVNDNKNSDIIGIMGLSGQISGTAVLTFPHDLAASLVAQMCGYEPEELNNNEINDGVTEILNMICGNAKALLGRTDSSFDLSVPTVITSQEYKISHHHDIQTGIIDFQLLDSTFTFLLSLKLKEIEKIS